MTKKTQEKNIPKNCFVIMPISDPEEYESGHFSRVYNHLIKPACKAAGLSAKRADDVKNTNYIIIDILKRIIKSDIVICDLSSKNPNVMYELGIRQAFNLPSILIKDHKTERVFDIQGIRTLEYDENLRIDMVEQDINSLTTTIKNTMSSGAEEVNSLIQLLGMPQAELSNSTDMSPETTLILKHIQDISMRITKIEDKVTPEPQAGSLATIIRNRKYTLPNGEKILRGDQVYSEPGGEALGTFENIKERGIYIAQEDGSILVVSPQHKTYNTISALPF